MSLAEVDPAPWSAQRSAVEQPQRTGEAETRRALHICNVCGYCNGLCPVFDAAKRRPLLAAGDRDQLANLCHHCRSCLYACQYAPPHPFALNLPRALARTRAESYARHAWPQPFVRSFAHPHRAALLASLITTLALLALVLIEVPVARLWAVHQGPGAFYQVLPWGWMVLLAGLALGWSLLALGVGLRRFWRASAGTAEAVADAAWDDRLPALATALREALSLRHLHGGGPGCADLDARPSHWRRRWHHALLYGVLLSVAATVTATLYHHLLGRLAPYPLWSAPVLLGSLGGLFMLAGVLGLGWLGARADPQPTAPDSQSATQALLWLLGAVALSGLLLLLWRETAAMALLLILHLGLVLALFLLLPYSKLVHGPYRLAALWRDALERQHYLHRRDSDG
ncbi:tricarballylate utilization 4Fe-4S protein TcuB [Halochromatium salexigens]|uniref:Signal transduction protein n=1 Tax=Halochromatium salexigens TaxID=49447 RepID=A0AAJ0UCE0_HALSE|nr:tricarballylate utilization 4Fe-4S protein TcuB [Halochromatium salexigens]MBK5928992.1 signal transduction protein [Halochromatium salexigens]